jgi:DNA-binding NarL/FixJ family response regulator
VVESPNAVTVDVRLPDGDGIDLAPRLRGARPGLGAVLFGPATPRLLHRAVTEGLSAYVPSTAGAAQAAVAIRSCLSGRARFSSQTLSEVLCRRSPASPSPREREVDKLLRGALSPADIAVRLQVTESTVRTYVQRGRAKAGREGQAWRRH